MSGRPSRRLIWILPVLFAVLAVGLFWLYVLVRPQPQWAVVIDRQDIEYSSASWLEVEYQTDIGLNVDRVRSFDPHQVGDTVLIMPRTRETPPSVASEFFLIDPDNVLVVAIIGAVVGMVVALTRPPAWVYISKAEGTRGTEWDPHFKPNRAD